MTTKSVYQIEANDLSERNMYQYLDKDGHLTEYPNKALEFKSFDECENYRLNYDKGNLYHTQKMVRG